MSEPTLENAFEQTFTEYGDAIFRFCLLKVSDQALAEDMTQDVFMRYWQYLRRGSQITNARSLLYTVAHNLAKDWYKKKKSLALDEQLVTETVAAEDTTSPEDSATYQAALDSLAGLSAADQELLLLRHVEGLEPKEIATITGKNVNVVSVQLTRAMRRWRKQIGV